MALKKLVTWSKKLPCDTVERPADWKPLLQSGHWLCFCKNTPVNKTFLYPLNPISIEMHFQLEIPDPRFSRFLLETMEATLKGMEAHGA